MIALNPFEIEAAVKEHGGLAAMAILTTQTCGEACWHAREDVCRCSCGGRNHGCLNHGGTKPERTSRIDGFMYRLKAVGKYQDIIENACEINRLAGYRSICAPSLVIDGRSKTDWTQAEINTAKASNADMWWSQYKYTWATTDSGAPARLKTASKSQRNWIELSGWKDEPTVYLLWERVDMPQKPTQLVIDKKTGQPIEDQLPDCRY